MKLLVDLGDRSYEVVVAAGARRDLAPVIAARAPRARAAAVVAPETLTSLPWFDLATGLTQHLVTVPDGEAAKTPDVAAELVERLASLGLSRDDVVVGVGGGATTDVAGFAAAVYLRGVAVVQVPTSLVGQVDAAVGGKTGVNLRAGKNLMGAFHQPLGVLCDTDTLSTLPERERRSGLGEVAKCWLLERRGVADLAAAGDEELIGVAISLKAGVVSDDEFEGGRRALLNYGHTLAHALETHWLARDPQAIRHGEAVGVGLGYAARLARALGRVDGAVVDVHDAVLAELGLSRWVPEGTDLDAVVSLMGHDKKARHDLTFVLDGPAGFEVVTDVDRAVVRDVLDDVRGVK